MSTKASKVRRSLRRAVALTALAVMATLAVGGTRSDVAGAAVTETTLGGPTLGVPVLPGATVPQITALDTTPPVTTALDTTPPVTTAPPTTAAPTTAPPTTAAPTTAPPTTARPAPQIAGPHPNQTPRIIRPHPHKTPRIVRPHPHKSPRIATPHFTHVVIGTGPAVAGFPVTLEGVTHLTDSAGKVQFDTPVTSRKLEDRISYAAVTLAIRGRLVQVTPTRLYRFQAGPQIALDLSYLVSFQFFNLKGLDGASINSLNARSMTGEVAELPAHKASWLKGTRAVPKESGLEVKNVDWSVQRVTYGGSNMVNESQQRFSPAKQANVDVKLLFYSVDIHVRDALFGFSGRGAVDLVFPNGRPQRFSLDRDGWLHLPSVPRGDYVLTALGSGPHLQLPLTISRNQEVDVGFFSWLDVLTVLGVVLALAAVLAIAGRIRRRPGYKRRRDSPQKPGVGRSVGAIAGLEDRGPAPQSEDRSSELAVASDRGTA